MPAWIGRSRGLGPSDVVTHGDWILYLDILSSYTLDISSARDGAGFKFANNE